MPGTVAKIAVSAATYWLDKPYDYRIPPELAEKAVPGVRLCIRCQQQADKRNGPHALYNRRGSKDSQLR